MKSKAIIKMYLIPTLLQITVIAALVGILKFRGFELGYNSFLGILFISLAGISSALWGIVYQVKCHSKRPLEILKDFFNIKQSVKSYTLVLIFLILEFSSVIINRGFKIESLFLPFLLFLNCIWRHRRIRVEIFISTWFREEDSLYCFNADYFCVLECMASLVLLYWWKFREHSYSRVFTRITNQLFYSFCIICLFQQSMDLCDDTCTDKYILSNKYKW